MEPPRGGVLHAVFQHVHQGLPGPGGIPGELRPLVPLNPQALLPELRRNQQGGQRLPHRPAQGEPLPPELHRARVDPGELQQGADQPLNPVQLAAHIPGKRPAFLLLQPARRQKLRQDPDRGQGRFQLVGDIRQRV